jgi:hypothetical protein
VASAPAWTGEARLRACASGAAALALSRPYLWIVGEQIRLLDMAASGAALLAAKGAGGLDIVALEEGPGRLAGALLAEGGRSARFDAAGPASLVELAAGRFVALAGASLYELERGEGSEAPTATPTPVPTAWPSPFPITQAPTREPPTPARQHTLPLPWVAQGW